MKNFFIFFFLIVTVFLVIACGVSDNSEEIAQSLEKKKCDNNAGFWSDEDSKCYNPCENEPCGSHGISCKNTGVEAYECKCEEGYFSSNGSKCVNPCDYNPCGSHGTCKGTGAETYECICEDNYFSDGSRCQNPCDPNPCGHGACKSTSAENYKCICDDNYFSNDTKCVNPCEDNPCGSYSTCRSTGVTTYDCKCDDDYFFNGAQCESKSNCTTTCNCIDGFVWDGSNCIVPEFPECTTQDITPCMDNATKYIWSARSSDTMIGENAESYCSGLTEGGYSDWTLPSLDVLKTLCNGNQSKLGDTNSLWSSSYYDGGANMYCIDFEGCDVYYADDDYYVKHVRCVRWQ